MAIHLVLNPAYHNEEFKKNVKSSILNEKPSKSENYEVIVEPFTCLILKNVVSEADTSLASIEKVLASCAFNDKNNDLYTFQQTADFKKSKKKSLMSIRAFFLNDILPWIKECTGIPIREDTIDISSSRYTQHDVLLCHDDELENRRLAFVWYLVPDDWESSDGGELELFSSDLDTTPVVSVNSILPRRNSLVLFEVSPKSWHQVAEVLAAQKVRLSINGWFNGPAVPRTARAPVPGPRFLTPMEIEEEVVYGWVSKHYLQTSVQSAIHDNMLEDSQLLLNDFLYEEKYKQLQAALRSSSVSWKCVGPPNRRHFDVVATSTADLPDPIRAVLRLMSSDAMLVVLSDMTGLSLHPLAVRMREAEAAEEPEKKRKRQASGDAAKPSEGAIGKVSGELRRWSHRCYTMISDGGEPLAALDANLFVDCEAWSEEMGGYHSYIVKDEDEELLCVEPTTNSLALVYRDEETLKFVKYVNQSVSELNSDGAFYDFSFLYVEPDE